MYTFLIRLVRFSLPLFIGFILLLTTIIYLDFFKVFFSYEKYGDTFVTLNRGVVTTRLYQKNRNKEKFDSFIFGSSRSQAFKGSSWKKYLDKNASTFHFDASLEGIYGVSTKIDYIAAQGDTIKNALLIVDQNLLQNTRNDRGHLFTSAPEVSGDSKFKFYLTYIKSSLNPVFLMAYTDYSIFKTYREVYMGVFIRDAKYPHIYNEVNGDVWYGYDTHIAKDSIGYYQERIASGVFYKRDSTIEREERNSTVTQEEKIFLNNIKNVFEKYKTNYKIIISPLYDQIPLEKAQLELLQSIFGEENVFDFSGKNKLTEPITNFYEQSHFRPHVADSIMKIIYTE